MTKDYYKILGVSKSATKEEIKKAYKKLAKKYHPDLNKEESSEQKFKEINEAASILADDEKRRQYDQFGTTDFNGNFAGGFDFDSIFESFFGGGPFTRRQRTGDDIRYDLEISLEEAAFGAEKTIIIPRYEKCKECNGTGAKSKQDIINCPECEGTGVSRRTMKTPFGMFTTQTTCRMCRGEGKTIKNYCKKCNGDGKTKVEREIQIKIPKGSETGTNLRIQGQGEVGEAGSGDLYIILHQIPHEIFERHGDDIYIEIKIPFVTATLSGKIQVPTLKETAELKIPAGTQTNTVFEMKSKGIPHLHGLGTGSQLVKVVVETPTKLSRKQKQLLQEFDKEKNKKGLFSVFS